MPSIWSQYSWSEYQAPKSLPEPDLSHLSSIARRFHRDHVFFSRFFNHRHAIMAWIHCFTVSTGSYFNEELAEILISCMPIMSETDIKDQQIHFLLQGFAMGDTILIKPILDVYDNNPYDADKLPQETPTLPDTPTYTQKLNYNLIVELQQGLAKNMILRVKVYTEPKITAYFYKKRCPFVVKSDVTAVINKDLWLKSIPCMRFFIPLLDKNTVLKVKDRVDSKNPYLRRWWTRRFPDLDKTPNMTNCLQLILRLCESHTDTKLFYSDHKYGMTKCSSHIVQVNTVKDIHPQWMIFAQAQLRFKLENIQFMRREAMREQQFDVRQITFEDMGKMLTVDPVKRKRKRQSSD